MDSLHKRCPHCKNKIFEVGVLIVEQVESWYEPYYESGQVSWGDRELGDPFEGRIECASCNTEIEGLAISELTPILKHKAFISNAPNIERIEQSLRVKGK